MLFLRHSSAVVLALSLAPLAPVAQAQVSNLVEPAVTAPDTREPAYSRVRKLAVDGNRAAALALAERTLEENPGDVDTRLFYGIVLSWEGRYDDARRELEHVIETSPTYADAILALVNVESWTGDWDRVEELAIEGRALAPANDGFLIAQAQAFRNTNRLKDAVAVLDEVVARNPGHREARGLRETILDDMRRWQVSTNQYYVWFSDERSHWEERQISLTRYTEAGSVSLGYTRALGFGTPDALATVEIYPRFRAGTYGYFAGAYSLQAALYPRTRFAGEIFQTLPGGTEASFGVRHFGFSTPFRLYTASVTKYMGGYWMGTARTYFSRDSSGISQSLHFLLRRYFDGPEKYIGVRYGVGASPFEVRSTNDIALLQSHTFVGDFKWRFRQGWGATVMAGFSFEDRYAGSGLQQYSLSAGLNYRF